MKYLWCYNESDWGLLGRREESLPSPGGRLVAMAKGLVSGKLSVGSQVAALWIERHYRLRKGSSEAGLKDWRPPGN